MAKSFKDKIGGASVVSKIIGTLEPTPLEAEATPAPPTEAEREKPTVELDGTPIPAKPESKSKKVQLLMKPSLFALFQKDAKEHDKSVNQMVSELIAAHLRSEGKM